MADGNFRVADSRSPDVKADRNYMRIMHHTAVRVSCVALAVVASVTGCTETFLNQTVALGGSVAGSRGSVRVVFINNTQDRAVFTFGTYDQLDLETQLDFAQFALDDLDARADILDGGETSDVFTLICGRVFALGSERLLDFVDRNASDDNRIAQAEHVGASFYATNTTDDEEGELELTGEATPIEKLLGVDFPCEALLIVRLEINDTGSSPFRADFEIIPAQSTR